MRTMLCLLLVCGLCTGPVFAADETAAEDGPPSEAGMEYILGCYVIEGCYALPHPEDWNGFAVFPGATEGLALYPCLLEPGDPAYDEAKIELERLLSRRPDADAGEYFGEYGEILMDRLSEDFARSINKYLEIIRFETPEDAQRAVNAYQRFFEMVGREIEPDAVFVYRNYTLFNMNYWSEEKSERYKRILIDGVESHDRLLAPEPVQPAPGGDYAIDLGDGLTLEMVWIEPATFMMGGGDGMWQQEEAHEVELGGYWIGRFEVTNAQHRRFFPLHDSGVLGGENINSDDRPVSGVTFCGAMMFCNALSNLTGGDYTLPSEAQWEYACGAGARTAFWWGDERDMSCANYGSDEDGFMVSAPVGSLKANAFGLYDMLGNVSEYCLDRAPEDIAAVYAHLATAGEEVHALRGGSFMEVDVPTRARAWVLTGHANQLMGFRVVCNPRK